MHEEKSQENRITKNKFIGQLFWKFWITNVILFISPSWIDGNAALTNMHYAVHHSFGLQWMPLDWHNGQFHFQFIELIYYWIHQGYHDKMQFDWRCIISFLFFPPFAYGKFCFFSILVQTSVSVNLNIFLQILSLADVAIPYLTGISPHISLISSSLNFIISQQQQQQHPFLFTRGTRNLQIVWNKQKNHIVSIDWTFCSLIGMNAWYLIKVFIWLIERSSISTTLTTFSPNWTPVEFVSVMKLHL